MAAEEPSGGELRLRRYIQTLTKKLQPRFFSTEGSGIKDGDLIEDPQERIKLVLEQPESGEEFIRFFFPKRTSSKVR